MIETDRVHHYTRVLKQWTFVRGSRSPPMREKEKKKEEEKTEKQK